MKLSYAEIKKIVYIMMAVLGACLLLISSFCFSSGAGQSNPLSYSATALILFAAGSLSLLFVFATYFISEDPEVWS